MHPRDLIELLLQQREDLEKATAQAQAAEFAVLDLKQEVAQAHEALTAAEAAVAQSVLSDTTLTNESKRQNALRDAKAKDPATIEANNMFRAASHRLAVDQAHLKHLQEAKANLELHGRNLRAAAELLAAQLHEQAQSKRQVASQQYLQGVSR